MRIAIDGSAIPRAMAGAGVYTYQLVRALATLPKGPEIVALGRSGLFDDLPRDSLRVVEVKQMSPPARLAWEQTVLPLLLRRIDADVLHSPHHHAPLLATRRPGGRVKRVVTIHDVTFLLLPRRYPVVRRLYMESVTRAAARVADAVIVPSEAVRADVVRTLGRNLAVAVVPEAASPHFEPIDDETKLADVRARYGLTASFFLSVGSLEPGKNRGRMILAYRSLLNEGTFDCSLAIVGQPAWRYEKDLELVTSFGLQDRIRFLGYVPDEDMPGMYSSATALLFPSLYEGFGLPVLEAMACGTPVIASDTGATAEIGMDAALLVDPRRVDAIASAMRSILTGERLRADLRERGLARAAEFSWERTARETLSVYEVVAAQH